ncbi:hypothetical protein AAU61_10365 [Desulfocarbo indianensis]|nr:hypothetical protein AAU61_10365 [Desulfocarbo indianensis]
MRLQQTTINSIPLIFKEKSPSLPKDWGLEKILAGLAGARGLDLSRMLQASSSVWLFQRLPAWASRHLMGLVGAAYFRLNQAKRSKIMTSLRAYLGEDADHETLRRMWVAVRAGIVDHYHEKLMMGFKPLDWLQGLMNRRLKVEGLSVLKQAHDLGRGVIMVTGHFGAVEFMPLSLAMHGYPLATMVHCKSQGLREALEYKASLFNTNLLDPKSESVLFRALQELKEGRVLITQCDELDCWRPYPNKFINFLGQEAGLDRSLDLLARKSRAPVVFGLIHRRPGGRYLLRITPVSDMRNPERGQVARACLDLLCQNIGQEPQAWYEWAKLTRLINDPPVKTEAEESIPIPSEAAA